MYVYSIPLDGGECSLLKKHGNFNDLIILSDKKINPFNRSQI